MTATPMPLVGAGENLFSGQQVVDYTDATTGAIKYGFAANVKRSGTGTDLVVGSQFNAYSINSSGSRTVFGNASEAWAGDASAAPAVAATLIGGESAVISQWDDNSSTAIVGQDIVFKNRTDLEAAAKRGLGSNGYNKSSIGLQISSQVRGTDTAYCGFKTGIFFTAASIDRTSTAQDGCCIDMSAVDASGTRLASAIRMPANGFMTWDSDARKWGVASGVIRYDVSGTTRMSCDSSGNLGVTGAIRQAPGASISLATNGQIAFEFTNNTTITVKGRGSDGTTRSATLILV
jgi:hypothetical protein